MTFQVKVTEQHFPLQCLLRKGVLPYRVMFEISKCNP